MSDGTDFVCFDIKLKLHPRSVAFPFEVSARCVLECNRVLEGHQAFLQPGAHGSGCPISERDDIRPYISPFPGCDAFTDSVLDASDGAALLVLSCHLVHDLAGFFVDDGGVAWVVRLEHQDE